MMPVQSRTLSAKHRQHNRLRSDFFFFWKRDCGGMKTFSVLFTLALLLVAELLGTRLRHAGLLPIVRGAGMSETPRHGLKVSEKLSNSPFVRL